MLLNNSKREDETVLVHRAGLAERLSSNRQRASEEADVTVGKVRGSVHTALISFKF